MMCIILREREKTKPRVVLYILIQYIIHTLCISLRSHTNLGEFGQVGAAMAHRIGRFFTDSFKSRHIFVTHTIA